MSKDLTAIFLSPTDTAEEFAKLAGWIETTVRSRNKPAILRITPLKDLPLVQIEVHDSATGMPTEDPELIGKLSAKGPATFVHVNHEAQQAIVHGFDDGKAGEGFVGKPDADFGGKLKARVGVELDALHAADDQSRAGIGLVATRTAALLPGRSLGLPVGMPSGLNSFQFHDMGTEVVAGKERCTFFAFDKQLVDAICNTPGADLAKVMEQARKELANDPEGKLVLDTLRALDRQPLTQADPAHRGPLVRAIEMLVLGSGRVFAAGDLASYWDERVLPVLGLKDQPPVIDEDEVEELDEAKSVLHALVEVVPTNAPPGGAGQVLESLADQELSPLLPAFVEDGVYSGSILRFDPTRVVAQLRALDSDKLSQAVARLEAAWWTKKSGQPPEGEEFKAFRRANAEKGQPDLDRALRHLSELRIVFEVAQANDLVVALAFYG